MNDLVKRKKTLPVAVAFERASGKVRTALEQLFAPPAPLPQENVERIRTILDELEVRTVIDAEIAEHRERALGLLRGVPGIATGAALTEVERLVAVATGATQTAAANA
jgi:geranylgeranyl pyrophosphate synthase